MFFCVCVCLCVELSIFYISNYTSEETQARHVYIAYISIVGWFCECGNLDADSKLWELSILDFDICPGSWDTKRWLSTKANYFPIYYIPYTKVKYFPMYQQWRSRNQMQNIIYIGIQKPEILRYKSYTYLRCIYIKETMCNIYIKETIKSQWTK